MKRLHIISMVALLLASCGKKSVRHGVDGDMAGINTADTVEEREECKTSSLQQIQMIVPSSILNTHRGKQGV